MYNKKRFEYSRFEDVSDSLSNLSTKERCLETLFLGMQSRCKAVELFSCLSENTNTYIWNGLCYNCQRQQWWFANYMKILFGIYYFIDDANARGNSSCVCNLKLCHMQEIKMFPVSQVLHWSPEPLTPTFSSLYCPWSHGNSLVYHTRVPIFSDNCIWLSPIARDNFLLSPRAQSRRQVRVFHGCVSRATLVSTLLAIPQIHWHLISLQSSKSHWHVPVYNYTVSIATDIYCCLLRGRHCRWHFNFWPRP